METAGVFDLAFCAIAITAAFAVRGTTGFGSAAIAIPLAALVLPAQTVIPIVANLQLVSTLDHGARHWRVVAWRELGRMLPCMLVGVAIGLYLFSYLEARTVSHTLGIAIMAYALFVVAGSRSNTAAPRRLPWPISALINTLGAAVGALFGGVAGPFYAAYLNALRLPSSAFRATMSAILLVQVSMRIPGYIQLGFVTAQVLLISVAALPFMFIGGRLGDAIAGRVDECTFKRVVGGVLLLSGIALLFK